LQCQMGKSWKIMENPCFAFQRIKRYLKSVSVCGLCGFAASGGVYLGSSSCLCSTLSHCQVVGAKWCNISVDTPWLTHLLSTRCS
jgi:hypothetical protein